MSRRAERDRTMRQGTVSPETPRDRTEQAALAEDIRAAAGYGKPLNLRLRNFRPSPDSYLAALGGLPPYVLRLREVSNQTAEHERRLADAWHECAAAEPDEGAFAVAWQARLDAWSFEEVNDLIDRHNRFYPIESRLPMDPSTGTYVLVNGEDYRRDQLDHAWALERFPASLKRPPEAS